MNAIGTEVIMDRLPSSSYGWHVYAVRIQSQKSLCVV
jgi:hypothetical protein